MSWELSWIRFHAHAAPGPEQAEVTGVSIDSRTLQPGELFVAIPGPRFDGHDFVQQAVAAGCAAILASRPPAGACPVPWLLTDDTQVALTRLAAAWRQEVNPRVIGVTGSSGKTTVKEMIAAALGAQFRVHATRGNLNNELGVPLTLLAMPRECQILVAEMGMNHPGEIARLAALARPDIGVITNVHPAHIAAFDGLEGIARAKAELLLGLAVDGVAVIPGEGEHADLLRSLAPDRCLTFHHPASVDDGMDVWAEDVRHEGAGVAFTLRAEGARFGVALAMSGEHQIRNALAAAAAALAAGGAPVEIAHGLAAFQPQAGRGAVLAAPGGWRVVDDSYNANPGSMSAALRLLGEGAGRRVAVLGDMLELGENAEALHAALATEVKAAGVALLITTGPLMRALHKTIKGYAHGIRCIHEDMPEGLLGEVRRYLQPGDTVLVKGSRGMKLERIVKAMMGN